MSIVKSTDNFYVTMKDLYNLVNYTIKPNHCICGMYGTQGLLKADGDTMAKAMLDIKNIYGKSGMRQALHYIVSFSEDEMQYITPHDARMIGYEVAEFFTNCQVVFGVHDNEDNLHIHFVVNTTSYADGRQYSVGSQGLYLLKNLVEDIVKKYVPAPSITTENTKTLLEAE